MENFDFKKYLTEGKMLKENITPDVEEYLTDLYDEIATAERYNHYRGKSVSMMDHFYDKLLNFV